MRSTRRFLDIDRYWNSSRPLEYLCFSDFLVSVFGLSHRGISQPKGSLIPSFGGLSSYDCDLCRRTEISITCPPELPTGKQHADVAELADALDSGSSGGNPVEVQVLSSALACSKGFRQLGGNPFIAFWLSGKEKPRCDAYALDGFSSFSTNAGVVSAQSELAFLILQGLNL